MESFFPEQFPTKIFSYFSSLYKLLQSFKTNIFQNISEQNKTELFLYHFTKNEVFR